MFKTSSVLVLMFVVFLLFLIANWFNRPDDK